MSHLLKLAMQSKIIISDLLKIDSFFFYFFYFHTLCTCSSHCLLSLMPPLVVFVTMDTKIMFGSNYKCNYYLQQPEAAAGKNLKPHIPIGPKLLEKRSI